MSQQRHVVKKQIIELQVSAEEEAKELQTKISQLYRQQIIPLIDRYCSENSTDDEIVRIDQLEIDLGCIRRSDIDNQCIAAVKQQLPQLISTSCKQARAAQRGSPDSELQLIDFFLRLGYLPWWASNRSPELLENALQKVIQQQANHLRKQLEQWQRRDFPLRRLVNTFTDIHLISLFKVLCPEINYQWQKKLQLLAGVLPQIAKTQVSSTLEVRYCYWSNVFNWLNTNQSSIGDGAALVFTLLQRMAHRLKVSESELKQKLMSVSDDFDWVRSVVSASTQYDAQELLANIKKGLLKEEQFNALMVAIVNGQLASSLEQQLRLMIAGIMLDDNTFDSDVSTTPMNDMAANQRLSKIYQALEAHTGNNQSAVLGPNPIGRVEPAAVLKSSAESAVLKHSGKLEPSALLEPSAILKPSALLKPSLESSKTQIKDEESAYIDNAGLVIFWPFLSRFFSRLNVLQEKTFRSKQAQYRATQLLEYLVNGETSCAEYQLPLNKLLCGLELTEIAVFDSSISEQEGDECEQLILAVIGQASILTQTSIEGFRHSFLQRSGVICLRDGAWLLRVEQETHDIVLGRLPWDIGWIKLPWMHCAMRVEWI